MSHYSIVILYRVERLNNAFSARLAETLSLKSILKFMKFSLHISKYIVHTVVLEYQHIIGQALSNFAFLSFKIFIGTQNKKNFSNAMIYF